MKKIFIDGGANTGQSIRSFRLNFKDSHEFEIYSFECNPNLIEKLNKYSKEAIIYEKALWVRNEQLEFYKNGDGKTDGGSLRRDKTTGNLQFNKPLIVNAIDIVEFIKSNFKKSDFIILKLDVEGAEYEILEHLLDNHMFNLYIDELYIEFHHRKLKKINEEYHTNLITRLKEHNVYPKYWDAHRNYIEE